MSKHGEVTLMLHLIEPDSLVVLAREGLNPEVIPTEEFRAVYQFAMDYFYECGRTNAPSVDALYTHFADLLDDHELDYDEAPADTIEWAIDDLKGTYALKAGQEYVKSMAIALAESGNHERIGVLHEQAAKLMEMTFILEDRSSRVDVREGLHDRVHEYDQRVVSKQHIMGARTGITEIDEYTGGIHDGELAVVAAGPKVGKSMFAVRIALSEWLSGRVPVLFTLENTVEMTLDRILCMMGNIDSREWAHGECTDEDREMVVEAIGYPEHTERPFWVLQPDMDQRRVQQLVRECVLRGGETLIIDQLSYIDLPEPRKPKNERIGLMLHYLHGLITTGRDRLPCFLMHQINREGVKAADKTGHLEMYHMAEAAEVERTAAWVFGIYASYEDQIAKRAKFQTLGARREQLKSWDMKWFLNTGRFSVIGERDGGR